MAAMHLIFVILIVAAAFVARWPHLRFPLDEDLATYTYIARFRHLGLRWKRDAFLFLYPVLRHLWLDRIYGNPKEGPVRVRLLLAALNAVSAAVIYGLVFTQTGNAWAALAGGLLYAFFLTAPTLEAESFSGEQCYVPFLLAGFWCATLGPAFAVPAGVAWGLMLVCKLTTGVYLPAFLGWMLIQQGTEATFTVFVAAALVIAFPLAVDAARGYLDPEAFRQIRARMVATLRTAKRDPFWPRLWGDTRMIVMQTLPLWVLGLPTLLAWCFGPDGPWFALLTGVTLFILLAQKGFTRYHYTPWVSLLAMACGLGLARIAEVEGWAGDAWMLGFWMLVAWTIKRQLPFYLNPQATEVMARYGKFEQLLYLPHLGRLLHRLMRRRGETGQRIYVWGNFTQIYHYTGCPAADTYVYYAMGPWLDRGLEPIFDSIIGGLLRHRPAYLIKAYPDLNLDRLQEITGLEYALVKTVLARYPVYRLKAFTPPSRDPLAAPWMEKSRWMEQLTRGRHMPGINATDLERGQAHRALRECRKLIRINPWDEAGVAFFTDVSALLHLHEPAEAFLESMVPRQPAHPRLRLRIAQLKLDRGQIEEAHKWICEEARLFGRKGEVLYALGLYEQARQFNKKAAWYFERAAAALPHRLDVRLHRAQAEAALNKNGEARRQFQALWEAAALPDQRVIKTQAAVGLARLVANQAPESRTLNEFLQQDPANESLEYAVASAIEREGHHREARDRFYTLTQTLTSDLLQAAAWFRLARLADNGDRLRCLNECLKRNPHHKAARQLLDEPEICHAPA